MAVIRNSNDGSQCAVSFEWVLGFISLQKYDRERKRERERGTEQEKVINGNALKPSAYYFLSDVLHFHRFVVSTQSKLRTVIIALI